MNSTKGYILSLLSLIFMSLAGPLQKLGSVDSHPLLVTLFSCSAAFALSLVFNLHKKTKFIFELNVPIVLLSILYTFAMIAFSFSISLENPFVVSAVGRSYIAFAFLLSLYPLNEKHSRTKIVSIFTIMAGSFCTSLHSANEIFSISPGVLLTFVYAFLFALHNSYLKRHSQISIFVLLLWQNLFSIVITAVILYSGLNTPAVSLNTITYSGLSGTLSSFLGFLFYHVSLRHLGFAETTTIRALSPVVSGVVVAPFFPPMLTPVLIFGFILILLGHYFYFQRETLHANTQNRRILSLLKRKGNSV